MLLTLELTTATIIAFGGGLMISAWPARLGLSFAVAFAAWALRAVTIFYGDVTTAEDYLGGLDVLEGAAEVAVAFTWMALCSELGAVVGRKLARLKVKAR